MEYAYQILTLANLPGERWEDLPGLDGRYYISNLGRVKREAFEKPCKNGQVRRMKQRILKCGATKAFNQTVKDEMYALRAHITMDGIPYRFSICRMVYYCFIKKFDLSDYSLVVLAKDGDGKNARMENLVLANLQRKQQRIYERERFKWHGTYSHNEYILDGLTESKNLNCVQVSQYNQEGKLMCTFPSITAAAVVTGNTPVNINAALKKRQPTAGGFYWRYERTKKINVKAERQNRILRFKEIRGQKVSKYSTHGKLVGTYLTISDAAQATGIGTGDISAVLSGRQQSAGGFLWKRGWGKEQLDVKGLLFGEALRAQRRCKKVYQYTISGKHIKTFSSVKEAAASLKIVPSYISGALNKKNKLAKGFRWITADGL